MPGSSVPGDLRQMRRAAGRISHMADNQALVIVHPSSLDSYTDLEYQATESRDTAYDIAFRLGEAVLNHKGPVIIVDQGWLFLGRESRPRNRFIDEIGMWEAPAGGYQAFQETEPLTVHEQHGPYRDITWIKFDEQDAAWADFLPLLDKILKERGVKSARLGGLFYEHDQSEGCVTEVYNHLRKIMPVEVALELVGCISDFYEPGEDLPGGYTHGGNR